MFLLFHEIGVTFNARIGTLVQNAAQFHLARIAHAVGCHHRRLDEFAGKSHRRKCGAAHAVGERHLQRRTAPESSRKKSARHDAPRIRHAQIKFGDEGAGFPAETLEHIFGKFYRVPKTKTGGTGLGLSIAKGFVEAHGGAISAENRLEKGARFIIRLPVLETPRTPEEIAA